MILALLGVSATVRAETPAEWISLGARVHGSFGAFIPLGIRIGEDALRRLDASARGVTVLYYDGQAAPCACIADGVALATVATVGQRSLTIAPEKAPAGDLAVVVVRSKASGRMVRYIVPDAALAKIGMWNQKLGERGRFDAVMAAEDLYDVEGPS